MAERKKVGLVYNYDENWVGGAYYIQNLVHAFNSLNDLQKPLVVLFAETGHFEAFKKATNYPYLVHQPAFNPRFSVIERILNKISRLLFKKNLVCQKKLLDIIFPVFNVTDRAGKPANLHWIPDFQEHYLPFFFSKEEIDRRVAIQKEIATKEDALLLLSSQSAYKDFSTLYPDALTRSYVVPFAVSHQPYEHLDINFLKSKYHIKSRYFISANQFWAHKNHRVIIDAVKILKDRGVEVCIVFTGRQNDWRNPHYFTELEELVEHNNISNNILFLGLIDRQEQLQLMNNAEAVIQPSKFEGWSTVIEDAKAMNQFVIASNIPVHIEQLEQHGVLFKPDDPLGLANIISDVNRDKPMVVPINYQENVRKYALDFLSILK